jgi:hypothetical protein
MRCYIWQNNKRKKNVIICNYSYYVKKENEEIIRYVCQEIGCSASITIENETDKILGINGLRLKESDDNQEN